MKKLFIALLCAVSLASHAQTATNTPPASTNVTSQLVSSNLVPVVSAVADWFKTIKPYLSNSTFSVEAGPLYSVHTKRFGEWGAVKVPVNDLVTLGFEAMQINGNIYYGPFSAQLGKEFKPPVIGSIYAYVESGPTLQFGKGATLGAQSFAGFQKKWDISPKWEFMIGGGTGNITGESGMIAAAQIAVSYKWGK